MDSCNKHQSKLRYIVLKEGRRLDQERLIMKLKPIICGWASYFVVSHVNRAGHLAKQDYLLYLKLRKWALVNQDTTRKTTSYWKRSKNKKWGFDILKKCQLLEHIGYSQSPASMEGYVKVKSELSPFD